MFTIFSNIYHATRRTVLPVLLILFTSVTACRKPAEPLSRANYYIQNKTTRVLRVDALQGTAEVPLLKDSINPGLTELFFTAVEGSGGHIYPSNFFTDFKVSAITANGDSLVYSGVKNNDWKTENNDNANLELVLTIE